MSQTITVTKLINEVGFKIRENEWRKVTDRIKKMTGLFAKNTSQISKSMDAGKRVANHQTKVVDKQSRAELKAYRTRQQILRGDNIRYKETLGQNKKLATQLQSVNAQFLKGDISARERSAHIQLLNKSFRSLNKEADGYSKRLGKISKLSRLARGAAGVAGGVALAGAAVVGTAAYGAKEGWSTIKDTGMPLEQMLIKYQNQFGENAARMINISAELADKFGVDFISMADGMSRTIALLDSMGMNLKDATKFVDNMTAALMAFGATKDEQQGFLGQVGGSFASNSRDEYNEAFRQWAPVMKADFEKWLKSVGTNIDSVLQSKKLQQMFNKYLTAKGPQFQQKAVRAASSVSAGDTRADNALQRAIFSIYSTAGFQSAIQTVQGMVIKFADILKSKSELIGSVYDNLMKVVESLVLNGFDGLLYMLKDLKVEDIQKYFGEMKQGIEDFVYVVRMLSAFIKSILPDTFVYPRTDRSAEEAARQAETQNWRGSPYAPGMQLQAPQMTFRPPSIADSLVLRSSANQQARPSNFSGVLDLKIQSEVNEEGFSRFVNYKIEDYGNKQINLVGGY